MLQAWESIPGRVIDIYVCVDRAALCICHYFYRFGRTECVPGGGGHENAELWFPCFVGGIGNFNRCGKWQAGDSCCIGEVVVRRWVLQRQVHMDDPAFTRG